ncbi:SDR family oxidoreductase [Pseudenhygromyxa sp. WMMC2535]|uniref:SDR family oxidoreductase n=1 Tax=Pseudenhygromyxa sp. WMMC2535 TaxID=2712867 RepID=UPI001554819E|nr:SDR family oxidoreductase [Pseudenhygromyxa sp. WMMC2535]NVB41051.1 SDR family oxidoreductase [Pseudenhygromyxa sp. WMMC2535]
MSLVALFKRPGPSGFGYSSTAEQVTEGVDATGKTFLVTGANSGLGLETTRVLSLRGAHVIAAARTVAKAKAALDELGVAGTPVACELSEPASVRACVEAVRDTGRSLDGIIANAGVMALPELQQKYGFELQFLTNHIGHFILVTGLLGLLTPRGRVVMLSSSAHTQAPPEGIQFDNLSGARDYKPWVAYGQSKLANMLFARQLAKRLPAGQTANAVHPGVIPTNLGRHVNPVFMSLFRASRRLFLKTIPQGAATQCYVALNPGAAEISGEYFADCNVAESSPQGRDMAVAEQLWAKSEEIVAKL